MKFEGDGAKLWSTKILFDQAISEKLFRTKSKKMQ